MNRQLLILPGLALLLSSGQVSAQSSSAPTSPVDVSNPTSVVGSGTPASCTEDAFTKAVASGGTIAFNCGASPYTLTLTSQKTVATDTVIDGGNLLTLSGGNNTRILNI